VLAAKLLDFFPCLHRLLFEILYLFML
jgi:hypothetical protein